jgi:hypothetical protein
LRRILTREDAAASLLLPTPLLILAGVAGFALAFPRVYQPTGVSACAVSDRAYLAGAQMVAAQTTEAWMVRSFGFAGATMRMTLMCQPLPILPKDNTETVGTPPTRPARL